MGQKVNPHGFRVGVIDGWDTQWYAGRKDFGKFLLEDDKIRKFVKKKYYANAISRITIKRSGESVTVNVYTSQPGKMIGIKGAGVELLKKEIVALAPGKKIVVNIYEVKRPDLDALLCAESIAAQLEKRASFRRTMKQSIQRTMRAGAKGVKVMVGGRLDGAEIARSEHYHEGSIPLQTLRADIDFGRATAFTTFGTIGVKVWIYKQEVIGKKNLSDDSANTGEGGRQNGANS